MEFYRERKKPQKQYVLRLFVLRPTSFTAEAAGLISLWEVADTYFYHLNEIST